MAPSAATEPVRARLSAWDDALAMIFGVWMVIGLFVDGWAHDNNKPETFFTPWHALLYSGFAAATAAAIAIAARSRRPGVAVSASLPAGHGTTLLALAAFGVAAGGDLIWHETLGVEVGVEALLSPTHLALLMSGLVAFSAPLRRHWATSPTNPPSLRSFLPVALSVTLMTALVGFFLLYLSPFVNHAASASFTRASGAPHDHPATDAAELRQLLGIASILVTTMLLSVAIAIVLRRWRTPLGTFTLMMTTVVLLFVGLDEFEQAPLVTMGLVAGAVADAMAQRFAPPVTVATSMASLWAAYFALYQLTEGGVVWSAELWAGVTVLSASLGGLVGLLALRRVPDPDEASARRDVTDGREATPSPRSPPAAPR